MIKVFKGQLPFQFSVPFIPVGAFEEELEERNPFGVFPDHFPNLLKSALLCSSAFVAMCQNSGFRTK